MIISRLLSQERKGENNMSKRLYCKDCRIMVSNMRRHHERDRCSAQHQRKVFKLG